MGVFVCCRLALRRYAALLGSSVYWLSIVQLRAEPEIPNTSIQLNYDAPPGCGSRELVLERVGQALSGLPTAANVAASVTVRESVGGVSVHYRATRDGVPSERELVVADCSAAVEASALLLSLTLDPVFGEQASTDSSGAPELNVDEFVAAPATTPEPNRAAPSGPTPAPSDASDAPSPESATRETRGRGPELSGFHASLGGQLVSGVVPELAAGVHLGLGASMFGVTAGVDASYSWAGVASVSGVPGAELTSRLSRLHLRLGYPTAWGPLRVTPGVGIGVEHLWARADGITVPASGASTWLSAVGGMEVEVTVWGPLAVGLRGGVVVSLQRPEFSVTGPGLVHRPATAGAEAGGGLVWSW